MNTTFFSIIIPGFNAALTIGRVIDSIQKQDFPDFELIIVDDGSTDNSRQIVEPYLSDKKIQYHHQTNKGVSAARNMGAGRAVGKFLIFLDSDDIASDTMLTDYYEAIIQKPDCLVAFAAYNQHGKIRGLRINNHLFSTAASVIPGSYCINREFFTELQGFDEELTHSENWELLVRLGLHPKMNADKIVSIPKVVMFYDNQYNRNRLLAYKKNKINSYQALYSKHKKKSIYSKKMVAFFAQVVANNHAGLGNLKEAIRWTFRSVKTDPFAFQNYYKPLLIFFKRRFVSYPQEV